MITINWRYDQSFQKECKLFLLTLPLKRSADNACLFQAVNVDVDRDNENDDDDDNDDDHDDNDDDNDNDDDDDDDAEKHLKKGALTMRAFAGQSMLQTIALEIVTDVTLSSNDSNSYSSFSSSSSSSS